MNRWRAGLAESIARRRSAGWRDAVQVQRGDAVRQWVHERRLRRAAPYGRRTESPRLLSQHGATCGRWDLCEPHALTRAKHLPSRANIAPVELVIEGTS